MSLTTSLSLLVLRFVTAGGMLYFHSWAEAKAGYMRVWREVQWPLVGLVRDAGFPQPLILASVGASIAFLAPVLLALGLLTRISAGAMLIVLLFAVIAFLREGNMVGFEICLLYGTSSFLLLVLGSGKFGADTLFAGEPPSAY